MPSPPQALQDLGSGGASWARTQHDNKTLFLKSTEKNPLGDPAETSKPRSRANPYSLGISTELRNKGKNRLEEVAERPPPSSTPEEGDIEQDDDLYKQGFVTRPSSPIDVEPTTLPDLDHPDSEPPITVEPLPFYRQPSPEPFDIADMSERPTELKVGTPIHFDGSPNDTSQWLHSVIAYISINDRIYTSDDKKIILALSFMSKGSAATWAEAAYENAAELESFGKWKDFQEDFK
ncbi:hypothetical protein PAXINDRAFT_18380 [Paxillus involutus ATCC 200175]|uniref:Unplaced genomic scaffold PAXINscaffold_289, whole genome shotgun sequence n=1 Tax=Paxillus involutus ATCC 200175 TaxID=664439 RepID=A0A0C9SNW2_PAXIN|nr:hypothetical protein PAXINDRAFT_18380 [Paxillus involutus ATCC 200175]